LLDENISFVSKIAKVSHVFTLDEAPSDPIATIKLVVPGHKCWLAIPNAAASTYKRELQLKLEDQQSRLKALQNRLQNKSYIEKAPVEIVEQSKIQIETVNLLISEIKDSLSRFDLAV
jgi:valyl-tRNA synthetase